MTREDVQKTIAVTGGTGFIGKHLLRELSVSYTVKALTRREPLSLDRDFEKIHWVRGDLENENALRELVDGCDTVIHVAGLIKARDAREYYRVNTDATVRLGRIVQETVSEAQFIFISSLAAAGPAQADSVVDESTPPHPITDYGKSKLKAEEELAQMDRLKWTILRPPVVYGPGDRAVLPYFRLTSKGWHVFLGNPDRRFSMVYVKDLVEAVMTCIGRENVIHEVFFVAHPEIHTWRSVAQILSSLAGAGRPKTVRIPGWFLYVVGLMNEVAGVLTRRTPFMSRMKVREILSDGWVCSSEKFQSVVGYEFQWDLERGARETFEWYREHKWI